MKRVIISICVIAVIVAVGIGVMAGMSHSEVLKVGIDGEIKTYTISRSYLAYLNNGVMYGGSLRREYESRLGGKNSEGATLVSISKDFEKVIKDIQNGERKKVESEIKFVAEKERKFEYKVGLAGRKVKNGINWAILDAMDSGTILSEIYDIDAPLSESDMRERTTLRRSFTTSYETSGDARRKNINIATQYLNGSIVKPGERLSFNDKVGKRTPERGFEEAKVIINGQYVEDYGGGVCQVSTTLYNAWVLSGGGVYYASNHSLPPHYVELSRDAMVSDYNDLILMNNDKYPIYVYAFCGINDVTFEIYGMKDETRYEIESEVIETLPISETIVGEVGEDDAFHDIVLSYGAPGYKSRAHLLHYDKDGNLISKSLLREDEYRCQPRIVKRVSAKG